MSHLRRMFEDEAFSDMVRGSIAATHLRLKNDSRVDVLCRSQTNIRGRRAHRLRCDEVEEFETEAWEAAQMITRSGRCGDIDVRAGVEALSTMHRPFGLMSRLVRDAESSNTSVFRWSVIDVLEDCPDERRCEMCPLHDATEGGCHGRAKGRQSSSNVRSRRRDGRSAGFFRIEDALDQRSRIAPSSWRSEMLCQEPDVTDCVYPEFSEAVHVFDDAAAPEINASITWLGGIDFGHREPAALLLAALDGAGVLHVMDEIVRSGCPTPMLIELAAARCAALGMRGAPPRPLWIGADPAGHQKSDQSGVSTISLWKKEGFAMRARASRIEAGLESVRARMRSGPSADLGVGLRIHRRCTHLIRALREYHYSPDRRDDTLPIKDGPDHACDALRYLIINLDGVGGEAVSVRDYLNRP